MIKIVLLFSFFGMFGIISAQVTPEEKAALLAFYNATDGPNWVSENDADLTNNWDFTGPVTDDWFGIQIFGGHVTSIDLNTINTSDGNNNLSGTLPSQMGDLKELVWLDLMAGNLTGTFPDFLFSLDKLQVLNLAQNNFNGSLPNNIGDLTELSTLQLDSNQFTGKIPLSLTTLNNLITLSLGVNEFSGEIPLQITQMLTLRHLSLSSNNFIGFIYPEYGNLTELKTLILDGNELTGTIPIELGNLTELEYLRIGRQDLIGNIPTELGNLSKLFFLAIRQTQINGPIPIEISNLSSLRYLYLNENQLDGQIPQDLTDLNILEILTLNGNQLENTIPDFTTNTNLYRLDFDDNRFQFGDFENQFDQYSTNISTFRDNPQAKVDEIESITQTVGENVTLTITVSGTQNHYQWFKDGIAIPDAPDSPSLMFNNVQATDAGVYHAEITSDIVTDLTLLRNDITLSIGCTALTADDPEDVITCEPYSLPDLSEDNFYYTDTNAGGTQLNAREVITTSQTLYVYTGTSGCSDENSFTITIDPLPCEETPEPEVEPEPKDSCVIIFPNFFTPNNDGTHDNYVPFTEACSPTGTFSIFDRYAKLVFQTNSLSNTWDGTFNGKPLPSSDYWYRFESTEDKKVITGHFSLKR